jgi:glutamate 5-kinase
MEVSGDFQVGDPVQVVKKDGTPVAYGISEYSSLELRQIIRKKSSEVAKILGYKRTDEVIHRNDLVVVRDSLVAS